METQLKKSDGTVIFPKIELDNNFQAIFDIVHPVGEVYVRYPNTEDPNILFNNKFIKSNWKKQDYGGCFFRADGTDAATFGGGQGESLPNVTGKCYVQGSSGGSAPGGLWWEHDSGNPGQGGTYHDKWGWVHLDLGRGNSIYKGSHVTPRNMTIEIYKREP